ncbi:MAG: DNA polymerase I [Candidatus Marinimicrobia bacterium]|nr:DNA polymerase I [Candidatus Neomarinimicrobiota bacterium]
MAKKKKTLYLIDGYAEVYRFYFAMFRNPLTNSKGENVSAIYGFARSIYSILKNKAPDYIAVAFDSSGPTFRHKKYKEYKATREKMPDDLRSQLPMIDKILEAFNVPRIDLAEYEADDIIGTLAKEGERDGCDVLMVTADKDFAQLVTDKVRMYNTRAKPDESNIIDVEGVIKKWGVKPGRIRDYLALVGDTSDNIPGVTGVGPKGAVKLLNEFDSLKGVFENIDKISGEKLKENLVRDEEAAELSFDLVTIRTDAPVKTKLEDLKRKELDSDRLVEVLKELEFWNMLEEIQADSGVPIEKVEKNYERVTDLKSLRAMIKKIKKSGLLSLDLETTSVNPMQAEIVGFSFSINQDEGWYVPIEFQGKTKSLFGSDGNDLENVLAELKPVLEDSNLPKCGQNIKYDMLILSLHGIEVSGVVSDSIIAAFLLKPEARSYKIDYLSMEYLGYKMQPITELIGSGKDQISMSDVALEEITFYAVEDADVALQLVNLLVPMVEKEGMTKIFQEIEIPLIHVLLRMEKAGVYLKVDHLKRMSNDLDVDIKEIEQRIHKLAGEEFKINSPKQLSHILFENLGLPPTRKTKTGFSTDQRAMEYLKKEHEIVDKVLEYRMYTKLKSTYLDTLPELIDPNTGRVHSTFSQTVAATGRLSSSDPNFQNIPIKTEIGRKIRHAFVPEKRGWKILSADYSQIELRIMAHLSNDPTLIQAFRDDEDIHSRTAAGLYGIDLKDVTSEMRNAAKTVNFAIMYGARAFRISGELGISMEDASATIDEYFSRFPGINNFIASSIAKAREEKFVTTILGRKRYLYEIDSSNFNLRQSAERIAVNTQLQGSAADMIKIAMINVDERIRKEKLSSMMILQVHDELVFEVPEEEVEQLTSLVIEEMRGAMELDVPVKVDVGVGKDWYEAH